MRLQVVPGVEVQICSNGDALQEYEDEEPTDGVRFIEATSGSNFAVNFRVDWTKLKSRISDQITCEVKLDGKYAIAYVYPVDIARVNRIDGRTGTLGGQHVLQRFAFGELVTNDGPTGNLKAEEVKHLGEVEVNLIWVRQLGLSQQESRILNDTNPKNNFPEKALKGRAISNRAVYGEAEPAPPSRFARLEYPEGRRSFAKFTFKYRSRKDLQIEGIIPRSPSPVPLEERDPESLSHEEARELIRRMRTHNNDDGEVKIKKEKRRWSAADDDEDDEEVEITGERTSKRARLSTDSGVELIDLTDD